MNVKSVVLKNLSGWEEPMIPAPFIGILTLKQTAILFLTFIMAYSFYQTGNWVYSPFVMIVGICFTFIKGKAFSPIEIVLNYFKFLNRNVIKLKVMKKR